MRRKCLYLCGAGNSEGVRLALNLNDRQDRWSHIALLDDDPAKLGRDLLGVRVEGPTSRLSEVDPEQTELVNLVARTTQRRHAVEERLRSYGAPFATLVHPNVDLRGATLEAGVTVYENAIIAPEAQVAGGSVIFMGAVVGHESRVGRCCVLAAGSVLNARVVLEDRVYVGTNAAVLPELRVGEDATIGACSSVISNVPAGATAIGVPAELVSRRALAATPAHAASTHGFEDSRSQPLEGAILQVWSRLLHRPDLAPDETFFDAGGSSLLALQARTNVQEALGVELLVTDLFRYPTARRLALHIVSMSMGCRATSPARARAEARRAVLPRRLYV